MNPIQQQFSPNRRASTNGHLSAILLLLPLLVAGCAAKKVSGVYTPIAGGAPVGAGAVRSYPSFADIKEGYRIQGMVSAEIRYGAKWSKDSVARSKVEAEKQKALLEKAATGLGVNSLVNLTSLKCVDVDFMRSCAILVNTGVQPGESEPARPKFIVGILPVTLKVNSPRTNLASRFATLLTPELQYHLVQKGYYTYRCGSMGVDVTRLGVDRGIVEALRDPLGIVPDFVLACEIEEGAFGFEVKALTMHVVMYDLQKNVVVWEDRQSMKGWKLLDLPELLIDPKGNLGGSPDRVHEAVELAVKGSYSIMRPKLSPVSGFGKLKK